MVQISLFGGRKHAGNADAHGGRKGERLDEGALRGGGAGGLNGLDHGLDVREQLLDFERELVAIKRDLDEREAALRPEKTIKDLDTISSGDEEDDPLRKKDDAAAKLPENNRELPRGTRRLAKATRVSDEGLKAVGEENKTNVVSRIEKLYIEAVREDRMVDADFYAKELKRMYPGWKYTPPGAKSGADVKKEEEERN